MQAKQKVENAAVLIAIAKDEQGKESVLLTQRAQHLKIHSGEVAFPGGKWEEQDVSLQETALRESEEEVGLARSRVEIVDQLSVTYTRNGISVTPYVGRVDSPLGLVANDGELESLFWVPVDFFLADARARTDIFRLDQREYWAPVYQWMNYTIWGFTARVMVEFLNKCYGSDIRRESAAPEVPYSTR
ncbi:MAG: CoA pyrophosphatase [Agarilytica sp.]